MKKISGIFCLYCFSSMTPVSISMTNMFILFMFVLVWWSSW